jgi:hypothetical protein
MLDQPAMKLHRRWREHVVAVAEPPASRDRRRKELQKIVGADRKEVDLLEQGRSCQ